MVDTMTFWYFLDDKPTAHIHCMEANTERNGECTFTWEILTKLTSGDFGDLEAIWRSRAHFQSSTSKQRNFDMKEALEKKCTTHVDAKSSPETIGGV